MLAADSDVVAATDGSVTQPAMGENGDQVEPGAMGVGYLWVWKCGKGEMAAGRRGSSYDAERVALLRICKALREEIEVRASTHGDIRRSVLIQSDSLSLIARLTNRQRCEGGGGRSLQRAE